MEHYLKNTSYINWKIKTSIEGEEILLTLMKQKGIASRLTPIMLLARLRIYGSSLSDMLLDFNRV